MKVTLSNFCGSLALGVLSFGLASAQTAGVLTVQDPVKLVVKRTDAPALDLKVSLKPGYHTNSNKPTEAYLIPLKLTWEPGVLEAGEVVYPEPKMEKYEFSDKPLSVLGGDFVITTKFQRAKNPALGPGFVMGKLRYQACNEKMCLPPKSVEVKLPVLIQ